MLHVAIFRATCFATPLRDKLHKKLQRVTAPLEENTSLIAFLVGKQAGEFVGVKLCAWGNCPLSYME